MWPTQAAHQSNKNYECGDSIFEFENGYIFVFATEVSDALEENFMTVYVKTITGKTISIKCDKNQKAAAMSDDVERRSSIPRGMTYLVHQGKVRNEKETIRENNIGAETTIEMSLRLLGRMDESDMKDTSETEEEREKRENWNAIRKSEATMESCSRKTDEKMDTFLQKITDSVGTQLQGMNSTIAKMTEEADDRYEQISERIMNTEKKIL